MWLLHLSGCLLTEGLDEDDLLLLGGADADLLDGVLPRTTTTSLIFRSDWITLRAVAQ